MVYIKTIIKDKGRRRIFKYLAYNERGVSERTGKETIKTKIICPISDQDAARFDAGKVSLPDLVEEKRLLELGINLAGKETRKETFEDPIRQRVSAFIGLCKETAFTKKAFKPKKSAELFLDPMMEWPAGSWEEYLKRIHQGVRNSKKSPSLGWFEALKKEMTRGDHDEGDDADVG